MIGKKVILNTLQAFFKERFISISDHIAVKTVVNIKLVRNIYEIKMKKYGEKYFNYDGKYFRVCATIRLNCEEGFYIHIKGIENLYEI